MKFLDTNIILRFLTRDDETKAKACFELFQKVEQGKEQVLTCEAIIAEVAYVLSSPRGPYHLSHEEIRARLAPILALRGLKLPQKRQHLHALDLYATLPSLDFEDALAVAHMEKRGITKILSYDTDFDRVPEVKRVEP